MTSVLEIGSEELSNSDLGDMQATDSNLVTYLEKLCNFYEEMMSGTSPMSCAGASPAVHGVSGMIEATTQSLCDSRNTKLWLQYLDRLSIVC